MKIKIEWIDKSTFTERDGYIEAEGAFITFEDGTTIDMSPNNHWLDRVDFYEEEIYEAILKHLGHTVEHEIKVEHA